MSKKVKAVKDRATIEERSVLTLDNAALVEYLGISGVNSTSVTETSVLGITAYWRALNIIAGTIASLPLKSYRETGDNKRERVKTFLDNPAGPYQLTPFAWKEMVMGHLLTQGETFLLHIHNNAGAIVGLYPIHPMGVTVKMVGSTKVFTVRLDNGTEAVYDNTNMTQVMGFTLDGIRGVSPLSTFRRSFQLGINADVAANRAFSNGALISGLVTPDTDMTPEEAATIKAGLSAKVSGVENAGDIAVINRALKFQPWAMTAVDAQFLESRQFQVTEFARMLGVPLNLLDMPGAVSNWGTGVSEANLGLQKFTLMPWTSRLEESLSGLLPSPRFAEFDYHGLLQGTPKEEIELLILQVQGGLLTEDEARAVLNLGPKPKVEAAPAPAPAAEQPAPDAQPKDNSNGTA